MPATLNSATSISQVRSACTTLLGSWLVASIAFAEPEQAATFRLASPVESAGYGQSVSIDGDLAAVMATFGPPGGEVWVEIYAYEGEGVGWSLEHARSITQNVTGGWAPGGLKLREERLFVAVQSDAGAGGDGTVRILERNAGGPATWGEVDVVQSGELGGADNFGAALDVEGDLLAVGAPDLVVPRPGTVYVFRRQPTGQWLGAGTLRPNDSMSGDHFGQTVAVSGTTVAASVPGVDPRFYVFEEEAGEGNGWPQVARFELADETQAFIPQLALDGDTLAVGAPHLGVGGGATIFDRRGGSWRRGVDILPSEVSPGEAVGAAVALENGRLAFTAPFASGSGAAFFYEKSDVDWQRVARVSAEGLTAGAALGESVDSDGASIVLGAPADAFGGVTSGAAVLFDFSRLFEDGFESGDLNAWTAHQGF